MKTEKLHFKQKLKRAYNTGGSILAIPAFFIAFFKSFWNVIGLVFFSSQEVSFTILGVSISNGLALLLMPLIIGLFFSIVTFWFGGIIAWVACFFLEILLSTIRILKRVYYHLNRLKYRDKVHDLGYLDESERANLDS